MLNYHHLRYFWLVAHEGNLTRAAQKHNISQSALSMQISALENALGQDLFERKGRKLILTEAGDIALEFADAIFSKGEELLDTLGEREQTKRDVLRVGALATLSRNFQIRFLRPALAAPDVEVIIQSGTLDELIDSLENYQLDIVLSNAMPDREDGMRWVAETIARQPVSLVGWPDPPRAGRTVRALLEHEPLVLPAPRTSMRIGFDALVHRLGLHPKIVAEVDDMAMLRLVARDHPGLAVVPPIVVKDELERGDLVEVADLDGLEETFFAITLQRRYPNPLLALVTSPTDETRANFST